MRLTFVYVIKKKLGILEHTHFLVLILNIFVLQAVYCITVAY